MIESKNTNELQGQYELDDLLPRNETPDTPDGYDAEGNLLNVDYPPVEVPNIPTTATAQTDPADITIPPQTSADAARLTALATEINAITEQTRGVVISAALAVGKRLIEAKSICPEGRFGEWLETAVSYSERKAQDMMRLYLEYGRDGSIPESIAALDYSKAVALLSAPAQMREALAGRAADEDMSVRELQQEIRRLKDEAAQAQKTIFDQDYALKRAEREKESLKEEQANTLANLKASRDINERMEGEHQDALEAKEEELKAAKRVIAEAAEKVSLAQAKAAAAEASADQLRKLHSDAEERAAASAQRASDAVNRANQTAKDLAEARAKIQALSEAAAAAVPEPECVEVEVIPEETRREIEQLKRELAEARALSAAAGTSSGADAPPSPEGKAGEASASEKFKWFYANQMKPTFTTALNLLREVAREDGHAADAYATALTNACRVLMNQLGTGERD